MAAVCGPGAGTQGCSTTSETAGSQGRRRRPLQPRPRGRGAASGGTRPGTRCERAVAAQMRAWSFCLPPSPCCSLGMPPAASRCGVAVRPSLLRGAWHKGTREPLLRPLPPSLNRATAVPAPHPLPARPPCPVAAVPGAHLWHQRRMGRASRLAAAHPRHQLRSAAAALPVPAPGRAARRPRDLQPAVARRQHAVQVRIMFRSSAVA